MAFSLRPKFSIFMDNCRENNMAFHMVGHGPPTSFPRNRTAFESPRWRKPVRPTEKPMQWEDPLK
jgi:hypothetical protein